MSNSDRAAVKNNDKQQQRLDSSCENDGGEAQWSSDDSNTGLKPSKIVDSYGGL